MIFLMQAPSRADGFLEDQGEPPSKKTWLSLERGTA